MKYIYTPWLTTEGTGGGQYNLTLKCPVCDCNQTHVQGAYVREGYETLPNTHRDTDGFRGRAMVIVVKGECEHTFEITFRQHKGDTFVSFKHVSDADIERVVLDA